MKFSVNFPYETGVRSNLNQIYIFQHQLTRYPVIGCQPNNQTTKLFAPSKVQRCSIEGMQTSCRGWHRIQEVHGGFHCLSGCWAQEDQPWKCPFCRTDFSGTIVLRAVRVSNQQIPGDYLDLMVGCLTSRASCNWIRSNQHLPQGSLYDNPK